MKEVSYSYKGYEGVYYGGKNFELWKDGKELLHTSNRAEENPTYENFVGYVKAYENIFGDFVFGDLECLGA